MTDGALSRNDGEMEKIRAIAEGGEDRPVLMMNLNRYRAEAGFPDGEIYGNYMDALAALLAKVGARVLWRAPVEGQARGEQALDEILAVCYPSHRAFLELPEAPGAEQNFRLRALAVAYAVIHRCPGDRAPLGAE